MLENIIEIELNKFMDDTNRQQSEALISAADLVSKLMEQVRNIDSNLCMDLEAAYTQEEVEYQRIYFKEGFITAFKLINEINNVKSLGNVL